MIKVEVTTVEGTFYVTPEQFLKVCEVDEDCPLNLVLEAFNCAPRTTGVPGHARLVRIIDANATHLKLVGSR